MPDRYVKDPLNAGPAEKWVAITPSDTTDFAFVSRYIYVGGTGNVVAVNEDNTTALFTAVPVGAVLHGRFRRVNSTSTTATALLAGY